MIIFFYLSFIGVVLFLSAYRMHYTFFLEKDFLASFSFFFDWIFMNIMKKIYIFWKFYTHRSPHYQRTEFKYFLASYLNKYELHFDLFWFFCLTESFSSFFLFLFQNRLFNVNITILITFLLFLLLILLLLLLLLLIFWLLLLLLIFTLLLRLLFLFLFLLLLLRILFVLLLRFFVYFPFEFIFFFILFVLG